MWRYTGQDRPPFALEPGSGQESVWDYPRPPALVADERRVLVRCGETIIADSLGSMRVLETASPPTFYIPRDDVRTAYMLRERGSSFCEWKGAATYWSVEVADTRLQNVAWSYASPNRAFAKIANYFSFYPGRIACYVDDERVTAQPGEFYGGWLTEEVVGPVKGGPGSAGW